MNRIDHMRVIWLSLYALVCIALFLPLGMWGVRDPLSLKSLLVEGGLIESLPTVVFVLTAVLALAVAWQLRRQKQNYQSWVCFSGLCLFLAGEEIEWGDDRVLGWQIHIPGLEGGDLHNWSMDLTGAWI